jgi:hypothetical protein
VELVEAPLSAGELAGVERLVDERFATDDWNFGR